MSEPTKRRATWRLGNRERSRAQLVVVVLICGMLGMVLYPPLTDFVQRRDFQVCQSNALHIARAIKTYTQDWDDTLPLAASWTDAAASHMVATSGTGKDYRAYLHCPLDESKAECSYVFNAALEGISMTVRAANAEARAHRARIGRLEKSPLIIERHGTARNQSVDMTDWDAITKTLQRPHLVPTQTGTLILGNLNPASRTREQLELVAGKSF